MAKKKKLQPHPQPSSEIEKYRYSLAERLRNLWQNCDNRRYWEPMRYEARKYDDFDKDRKKGK